MRASLIRQVVLLWLVLLVCMFALQRCAHAASAADANFTKGTVSVTSTTVGKLVVKDFRNKVRIVLDPSATVQVWVLPVSPNDDGSDPCPAAMTSKNGIPLSASTSEKPGLGWEYVYDGKGGRGPVCAILGSSGSATLYYSTE